MRVDEQLGKLEKNRLLLIYYSKVKYPFLAGDTVKVFYKNEPKKAILLGFFVDSECAQKYFRDGNSKESLKESISIPEERYLLIEGAVVVVDENTIAYPKPKLFLKPLDKKLAEQVICGTMGYSGLNPLEAKSAHFRPRLFSREDQDLRRTSIYGANICHFQDIATTISAVA